MSASPPASPAVNRREPDLNDAFALFSRLSPLSGEAYLQALAEQLGTLLGAETTFVALALDKPVTTVRGVAAWKDGARKAPWEFKLEDNPCQLTYAGEPTFISCDVARRFAGKTDSGYESYIGIPLKDTDHETIGHIAIYGSAPRSEGSYALDLAKLCGNRAEAEIRALIAVNEKITANAENQAKSEILARMSHEIRTPMAGVMGLADMLLDDGLSMDSRQKVYKMKDATRFLLKIVNEILDVSKLNLHKMELEALPTNIRTLADDTLSLFQEKRAGDRRKGLALNLEFDPDCPHMATVDPTRLRQILVNLIGNAVKFTEAGSVTLVVSLDRPNGMLEFRVIDTGIGIAPENMDKLFDDFTQADQTISRRFEGTGLGLSICRGFVQLMGGDIDIDSQLGQGSTFRFTLPYQAVDAAQPLAADAAPSRPEVYGSVRPLEVLIVDDNELNRQIAVAIMDSLDHRSTAVSSGEAAIEQHLAADYDVILMDIHMPGMSGTEAARTIRNLDGAKNAVPIIALTADAISEHRQNFLDAGMNQVVTKPIDRAELARSMNVALGEDVHVSAAP